MSCTFSMIGLFLAIAGYEVELYYDGYKGLSKLSDTKHSDQLLIQAAIKSRLTVPFCHELRLMQCISSILCIILMILRQKLIQNWFNTHVRKELYVEFTKVRTDEFYHIESIDEDGDRYVDKICDKQNELFEANLQEGEDFSKKMGTLIDHQVSRHKFFSKSFFILVTLQFLFPWPYYDGLWFMPQLASSKVATVPYFSSDMLLIIMFLRCYSLIRHYERYHEFTDCHSKAICRRFGVPGGRMFAIKCELKYNETFIISVLFFGSVIILSFILRVFELPYE